MNVMKKTLYTVAALVFALAMANTALAQDTPFAIENVPNVVGVAVGMLPDYEGSNDYRAGGAPFFKLTYPKSEWYLILIATELSANILNHPFLRLGPAVNYRFGRNDSFDAEDDVIERMTTVKNTVEAGAFAGVEFRASENPRNRFIASVTFLSDVGDEYKGYNISLLARYWHQAHQMVDISLGAGATYADDNYMDTYFSVDQENAGRTGLNLFRAESGIKDFSVSPAVVVHLSRDWHVAAGARYKRLLDDAEDSPLVDEE
ncbi:MAG: MipA/OmpV family protein, partial [Nitrospirota bacterium]